MTAPPLVLHLRPVVDHRGATGWLLRRPPLYPRVVARALAGFGWYAVTDEPDVDAWWVGEEYVHDVRAAIAQALGEDRPAAWCAACAAEGPCPAWEGVPVAACQFHPRTLDASQPPAGGASGPTAPPGAPGAAAGRPEGAAGTPWDDVMRQAFDAMGEAWSKYAHAPPVARNGRAASCADAAKTLGIAWPCDEATVVRAYRSAALRWHPDRPDGNASRFLTLTQARDTLMAAIRV